MQILNEQNQIIMNKYNFFSDDFLNLLILENKHFHRFWQLIFC